MKELKNAAYDDPLVTEQQETNIYDDLISKKTSFDENKAKKEKISLVRSSDSNGDVKIGFIFPGQGVQFVGMGKEIYDDERIVQDMFEEASICLDQNFVRLCFASSEAELRGIEETQTSIFLVSAAIFRVLKEKYGIKPDLVAGHSLGEYTAIHAAGGMNFPDTLYLLGKRARILKQEMEKQNGGMIAVLGFPEDKLKIICERHDDPDSNEKVVEIVNYNSPTQFVVAGTKEEVEKVKEDVQTLNGKVVDLPVIGAFHTRMLRKAETLFSHYLFKVDFKNLEVPLVNNVMAQKIKSPEAIKLSVVNQTSSHLLWWKGMQHFKDMDIIVEVGPNNKFSKILKREWPDKNIISVNNQDDIDDLLDMIDECKRSKKNSVG